jgi:outer membrane receptor protein involved in Fe transport
VHRLTSSRPRALAALIAGSLACAGTGAQELEEIIVTAQKREQRLQDVPISASVVMGDELRERGLLTATQLAVVTPGLSIVEDFFGTLLNVRGVGSYVGDLEQSVATFIDGIYAAREGQAISGYLDVASLEILRGPQPVYFGQGATAGALNVRTRDPGDEWNGFIDLRGSDEEYSAEGAVGGPLSDAFGVRIAAKGRKIYEGWMTNTVSDDAVPEREESIVRVKAGWTPSDTFSAVLRAEYGQLEQEINVRQIVCTPTGDPSNLCDMVTNDPRLTDDLVENDTLSSGGRYTPSVPWRFGFLPPFIEPFPISPAAVGLPQYFNRDVKDIDQQLHGLALRWALGAFELASDTGYYKLESDNWGDGDQTGFAMLNLNQVSEYEQVSQEFRLSMEGERFDWLIGLYAQDVDNAVTTLRYGALLNTTIDPPGPGGPFPFAALFPFGQAVGDRGKSEDEFRSVFASGTWRFAPRWAVQFGGRYTDVSKDGINEAVRLSYDTANGNVTTPLAPRPPAPGQVCGPAGALDASVPTPAVVCISDEYEDSEFDPYVDVQWRPNDDLMLYAKYAEGFKAGGFVLGTSGRDPAQFIVNAERAESYELGIKYKTADRRLRLNAALFHAKYEDFQLDFFDVDSLDIITGNGGTAETRGVEVDLDWAATELLTLRLAATVLDAEWDEYIAGCNELEVGTPECSLAGGTAIDRSGTQLVRAPDWKATASARHVQPLSGDLELLLFGEIVSEDDQFIEISYDPRAVQDSTTLVNLRIGLARPSSGWEVEAFGNNITDERRRTVFQNNSFIGVSGVNYIHARDAEYGVRFGYRF